MDDVVASSLGPESQLSIPLSRPGIPDSGNEESYIASQHVKLPHWDDSNDSDDSYDSTSASPSREERETDGNGGNCDKMVEKWRLIRLADKNTPPKKIYPTHDVHTVAFGENYSKFYEAFQQGVSTPKASKSTPSTVPAKRSAAASKQASKRRRHDDRASLPHLDQHQARVITAQRTAATKAKASLEAKSNEAASLSDVARKSPEPPRQRSYLDAKEQSARRKGVGIYAGNWEYVTDEEKEPEYLSVVQKTAEFEGRTTRRAYAKMTSKEGAGDSDKIVGLSSRKQMRKSGRARNAVDYTRLSGSESSARGIATPEQVEENDIPPAQETEQISPSKSTLTRSALMPDHLSSSTSTSAAMYAERPERPKLSWNAIVYEVLAISETPLKFPQLVQGVKDRYPFFNSSSQEKVLESGVKNPLYFHEAFCKGEMIDGKQTWGLKPGEFIDKKTGEVLTPRPRHTISSPSPSINEQLHEMEDQSPIDLASTVTCINNPASSQPRFGREILNSPEIPDSQDAKAITPSPQGADILTATEHTPHLEEATGSQELADAAGSTSVTAFVETNLNSQSPQPSFQWATPTFSPINTISNSKYSTAAGTKIQSVQNGIGATGHEASASAAQLLSTPQTAQGWTSSISSSTGESESGSSPTSTQVVSTSVPLVHAVSHTPAPNLLGDCAAASETPYVNSTKSTPSVTEVACTQLDDLLPDVKAGAKENAYVHLQQWE